MDNGNQVDADNGNDINNDSDDSSGNQDEASSVQPSTKRLVNTFSSVTVEQAIVLHLLAEHQKVGQHVLLSHCSAGCVIHVPNSDSCSSKG